MLVAACAFEPPSPTDPILVPVEEVPAPDPDFGVDGFVILDDIVGTGIDERARTLTVLPDGGLAIAVVSELGQELDSAIVRLSPTGEVRWSSLYRTSAADYLEAVVADESGAIYAAGTAVRSSRQAAIVIAKYWANGEMDSGFGSGGALVLDGLIGRCAELGMSYQVAFGMRFDPEMRLVVSGNVTESDCVDRDMVLLRVDRNTGALDPSFGTAGVVTTRAPGFADRRSDNGQDVLPLPDGRIAVVGNTNDTYDFETAQAVLWIHRQDGTEQSAVVLQDLDGRGSGSETFRTVSADHAGRILAGGRTYNGSNFDAVAVRFNEGGKVDPSFADGGVFVFDSGGHDRARRIAVDGIGRILLVGYVEDAAGEDLAVWRLTPDGALDPDWGEGGLMRVDLGGNERGEGIAFDARGRTLISGSVQQSDGSWAVLVARLTR